MPMTVRAAEECDATMPDSGLQPGTPKRSSALRSLNDSNLICRMKNGGSPFRPGNYLLIDGNSNAFER